MNQIKPSSTRINSIFKKGFLLIALADILFILTSNSTFDSGDSVLHYLHAKQAIQYPRYFLEHWSKPLFVLLAALPAQAGFVGMKIFNALCVLSAAWFAFKYLEKKHELAWMVIPFVLFMPEFFLSQASGLTEPLFSALLMLCIYLWSEKNWKSALILASFLPFVRSEGWFVLPFFGLIALLSGQWKHIFWLLTGHLVYGLAGGIALGDFLWMFHQNPYQGIEPKYGSGHWSHFLVQTPYLLGIPLSLLFAAGILSQSIRIFREIRLPAYWEQILLVYGITIAFYVAHSLFWQFGLFHSFGLKRVFIAVLPLVGIICVEGASFVLKLVPPNLKIWSASALTVIVIFFPFSDNKTGFLLPDSFELQPSQNLVRQTSMWYLSSPYKKYRVAYGNHYFGMTLHKDMDNPDEVMPIGKVLSNEMPAQTLILWDNYFSVTDQGVDESWLLQNGYRHLRTFEDTTGNKIMAFWKE